MIKIAEYLAAGRPVVAYDLTETRRPAADAVCLAAMGPGAFAELRRRAGQDETLRRDARRAGAAAGARAHMGAK